MGGERGGGGGGGDRIFECMDQLKEPDFILEVRRF